MLVAKAAIYERKNKKGEWERACSWTNYRECIMEESKAVDTYFHCESYSDLEKLSKREFPSIHDGLTFFSGKSYIFIGDYETQLARYYPNDVVDEWFRIRYKDFSPSMDWLLKNCTADQFVQYAKDRGWTNILLDKIN